MEIQMGEKAMLICTPQGYERTENVDVLLIVHLSIYILEINQLDAQNLFYNKFISCLYMF
jgi:hypothetical protein